MAFDEIKDWTYGTVKEVKEGEKKIVLETGEGALFSTPVVGYYIQVWPAGSLPLIAPAAAAGKRVEAFRIESGGLSGDTFTWSSRKQLGTEERSIQVGDQVCSPLSAETITSLREYTLPTYAELIAVDVPVNGWDCQDSAGATELKATYGAQAMTALKNITSGVTTNPLYPGAKSIKTSGEKDDGAKTAAAGALTTYMHSTGEVWVYLAEDTKQTAIGLFSGKNTSTFEGLGVGMGGTNFGSEGAEGNFISELKPGVTFNAGSGASNLNTSFNHVAEAYETGKGWHHLCWRVHQANLTNVDIFLDGVLVAIREQASAGSYGDHTANERTWIGNYVSEGATSAKAATQYAHAYIYNRRLSDAAIRARSNLVNLLSA